VLELLTASPDQPEPEPFVLGVRLDESGAAVWTGSPSE
jgi:hypothetical protein